MNPLTVASVGLDTVDKLKNLVMGFKQKREGKKLQQRLSAQGRPIVDTPNAFKEQEGLVRANALDTRFAGQTAIENNIKSLGANQLQRIQDTAGSGMDALLSFGLANANTNKQLTDVGLQASNKQQQDYSTLLNTLGQKAQYEQNNFNENVMKPFIQASNQAQALKQAGQTNIHNALNDSSSLLMSLGQYNDSKDAKEKESTALVDVINKMYGGTTTNNNNINASKGLLSLPNIGKNIGNNVLQSNSNPIGKSSLLNMILGRAINKQRIPTAIG